MFNHSYKKLKIWEKAMNITKKTYKISKKLPKEETYGLTSQMRRSAVSIPSNIAEGSQRKTDKDFANFISIAKGSLVEMETQLILSKELEFLNENELIDLFKSISELDKMLYSFYQRLTNKSLTAHS